MTLTRYLVAFGTLAVIAVVVAVILGTVGLIQSSLNGTLTIPTAMTNAINTLGNLAGTGFIIAAAVIIILIVSSLLYVFGVGRRIE